MNDNANQAVTHSSRLEQCFATLKQQNRPALVSYLTAGDPDADTSRRLLHGLPALLQALQEVLLRRRHSCRHAVRAAVVRLLLYRPHLPQLNFTW